MPPKKKLDAKSDALFWTPPEKKIGRVFGQLFKQVFGQLFGQLSGLFVRQRFAIHPGAEAAREMKSALSMFFGQRLSSMSTCIVKRLQTLFFTGPARFFGSGTSGGATVTKW